MAGSQEDPAGSIPLPYNVAGRGRAEDTILTDQQFFNPVSRANLGNQLDNLRVVVTSIAADDEEAPLRAFRNGQ